MGSIPIVGTINDSVAQQVEQLTFNQWVRRSSRLGVTIYLLIYAWVAEQVDAQDLKSCGSNTVRVRFPP